MRIGIDSRFYAKAGPGRYTKNIIQHLEKIDDENEYIIFLTSEGFEQYIPINTNFKKVLADHKWYTFDEQIGFLFKVLKQNLDIYYVPHFNIPVLYPKKIVTAIPDMTMHTYSTEKGTTLPLWYFKIKKIVYKQVFWWAVLRSKKVIVPSKNVLQDFLNNLPFKKRKYVLAYEGVDPDFLKRPNNVDQILKKYGIDRNYILSVGSMYEHKNIPRLIEMFVFLKEEYNYKGQLVLASKKDKFSQKIYELVKEKHLEADIKVLAYLVDDESSVVVSDEEITALRLKADLYTMAALKEGFSLTALEGMVLGLPAVLSDIPCHREVYGDSVMYYDPYNTEDMALRVNNMLRDNIIKEEYIKKGYLQVKKYSWLETAKITLDVFKNI